MRTFTTAGLILAATLVARASVAQTSPAPPAGRTMVSAADVAALVAKAKTERKDQSLIAQSMIQLAPYNVSLEYRPSVGVAAVHNLEAELFFVVDGGGTLVTGGTLANAMPTNADNVTGTAIDGGVSRTIAKGDWIIVPEGTPHWFSRIDGTLVVMSLHLPRPAATGRPAVTAPAGR